MVLLEVFTSKSVFMAHSTDNIATHGLSGKIGQFVFRQRHGKTIVAKAACEYPPPTTSQKKRQNSFKQAVAFAKELLADPAVKLAYQAKAKPGQTAYNVAIGEFLRTDYIV